MKGRVPVFALVLPHFHTISCHCRGVPLFGPNSQGQKLCHFQIHCESAQGGAMMGCAVGRGCSGVAEELAPAGIISAFHWG